MLEDIEFLWSQVHFLAAYDQLPGFEIEREIFRDKGRQGVPGSVAPQCGANAREQFFDAKWFNNIIVRSSVEREHFVPLRVSNREHNNGSVGGFANLAAGGDPADARHVHVEKHQVGLLLANSFHRFLAGLGLDDDVPLAGESGTKDSPDLRL